MKNNKKILLLFVFLTSGFASIYGQYNKDSQGKINEKIEYINQRISNINLNLTNLKTLQENLVIWFEDTQRKKSEIPTFKYKAFSGAIISIPNEEKQEDLFNHNYHISRLEKEFKVFASLCRKIEKTTYNDSSLESEKKYTEQLYNTNIKIQNIAKNLANIAYDFSRSCAVNYKNESIRNELQVKHLKNLVSQSKNMILAFRENNENLVKEYSFLLNQAIFTFDKEFNTSSLKNILQSNLSLEEIKNATDAIYQKAFNIASWGDVYLQNNDDANNYLPNVIAEFASSNETLGSAIHFNELIKSSQTNLMFYTDEPNMILAEKISISPKNNYSKETFDPNNNYSLAGALPNNLIVLLDVSASMKKSGKMPMLRETIAHFLNIMRDEDKVSLITYSGETQILISGGSNKNKEAILDTLSKIRSMGSTDIYNALKEAKKVGDTHFINQGNNKIIIASDGIFGVTASVKRFTNILKDKNYSLSVFQFCKPKEETNLAPLQDLAKIGNGNYTPIFNAEEAIDAMMQEIKKQNLLNR